jgi:hypothetical protein
MDRDNQLPCVRSSFVLVNHNAGSYVPPCVWQQLLASYRHNTRVTATVTFRPQERNRVVPTSSSCRSRYHQAGNTLHSCCVYVRGTARIIILPFFPELLFPGFFTSLITRRSRLSSSTETASKPEWTRLSSLVRRQLTTGTSALILG